MSRSDSQAPYIGLADATQGQVRPDHQCTYVPERSCPAAQSRQATEPRRRGEALSHGAAPSATARSSRSAPTRGTRGAIGDLLGQGKLARRPLRPPARCRSTLAVAGTCSPRRGDYIGGVVDVLRSRRPAIM
jgi:hypothetical protein